MATLFISDLHLEPERPDITARFLALLRESAPGADSLYILGDLFEAWVGDDDDDPLPATIASAIAELTGSGVPCHFMHGNRDFLLGADYAARCGMALLPESLVIDLHGTPTLLLHGDTLCTDDFAYQVFRKQARNPAWQAQVLAQPLAVRRAMARQARAASAAHMAAAAPEIMDVNADTVRRAFADARVPRMIHGHTHRPAVHALDVDGSTAQRVVLGDWHAGGWTLWVDAAGTRLSPMDSA